jgi:hypothetical protein
MMRADTKVDEGQGTHHAINNKFLLWSGWDIAQDLEKFGVWHRHVQLVGLTTLFMIRLSVSNVKGTSNALSIVPCRCN